MSQKIEDAFVAGYHAGFNASGEGWNGEYPFEGKTLESDAVWLVARNRAYADWVKQRNQSVFEIAQHNLDNDALI